MQFHSKIWFLAITAALLCACPAARSQDIVILEKKAGAGESKRKGEIISWIGDVISVKAATGVKELDADRRRSLNQRSNPSHVSGCRTLFTRNWSNAI